jgi:hypothetical protein
MSSLLKDYSREVARELTKIPVVLPGEPVSIGDVLVFPEGRTGLFGWRIVPWGSFQKVHELKQLLGLKTPQSIPVETGKDDRDTYLFASRRSTSVHFSAEGSGPTPIAGVPASVGGKLNIGFKAEGATYLAAVGCKRTQMKTLDPIVNSLASLMQQLYWKEVFIVSSVTVAERALVMQSATSSGSLEVSGDVQGLLPGGEKVASAAALISITSMRDASFIKPWSENVPIFFSLVRIKGKGYKGVTPLAAGGGEGLAVSALAAGLYAGSATLPGADDLEEVSPLEIAD